MDKSAKTYVVERKFKKADFYGLEADFYCNGDEESIFIERDIFFPQATELDLSICEKALKCNLPKSYRNFLLIHDGALLSTLNPETYGDVDFTDWMYAPASRIIMNTKYLVKFTDEQKDRYFGLYKDSMEDYNKRWANLIAFCYCGAEGDGSFLAFDPTQADGEEYPILYCLSTENIEDWRGEIYYKSFKDFFIDVLESAGIGENYEFLDRYLKSLE